MNYFPGIHWIGDWEGFRTVLNIVAKRKVLAYFWNSNLGFPLNTSCRVVPVLILYMYLNSNKDKDV